MKALQRLLLLLAFSCAGSEGTTSRCDSRQERGSCSANEFTRHEIPTKRVDSEAGMSKRRSLLVWEVVWEGCTPAVDNGWNTYIDGGCCNKDHCPESSTPNCIMEYHACDQYLDANYYGPGQDDTYCQCSCKPGWFTGDPAKTECCKAWSATCDTYQGCHVQDNLIAYCKDSSIRVALIEKLSDHSTQEEACIGSGVWLGGKCVISEQWHAVYAAALLAVKHFNDRHHRFTPALETMRDCSLEISITDVVDSMGSAQSSMRDVIQALKGRNHFVVGPAEDEIARASSYIAAGYGVPLVSYNFGSHVENGDLLNSGSFVQGAASGSEVARALCLYLKKEMSFSSAIVINRVGDGAGKSFTAHLKVECTGLGVGLQEVTLSEGDLADDVRLEDALVRANATRLNGVIYPCIGEYHKVRKVLEKAFEVKLLRPGSMWVFVDEKLPILFDQLSLSLRNVLHGSALVQVSGGSLENPYYHHLVGAWASYNATELERMVPEEKRILPENFFQTFDPYKSTLLRTYGAFQYDMITAFGMLACKIAEGLPYAHPRDVFRNSLISGLSDIDFEGLTGRVKFQGDSKRRDPATSKVSLYNVVAAPQALDPTASPTMSPTMSPTDPTAVPTGSPTTDHPTLSPTLAPVTDVPSTSPTPNPTQSPSTSPTANPTVSPTFSPTQNPTSGPTVSSPVTVSPTESPTTGSPTVSPTTSQPTQAPTHAPTDSPTSKPTASPTRSPTPLSPYTGFHLRTLAEFNVSSELFTKVETSEEQLYNGGSMKKPTTFVARPAELLQIGLLHPFTDKYGSFRNATICDTGSTTCFLHAEFLDIAAALLLGVRDFNARSSSLIPGLLENIQCNKKISMRIMDTQLSEDVSFSSAIDLLDTSGRVDALIGPQMYESLMTASALASVYQTPHVSFSSMSSMFDLMEEHTSKVRLTRPHPAVADAVCSFWKRLGYSIVTFVLPKVTYGTALEKDLSSACGLLGIETSPVFFPDMQLSHADQVVNEIATSKSNIVLVAGKGFRSLQEKAFFERLFEQASLRGLLGKGTMWVFIDWYMPSYMTNLSETASNALQGSIHFEVAQQHTSIESLSDLIQSSLLELLPLTPYPESLWADLVLRQGGLNRTTLNHMNFVKMAYDAALLVGLRSCDLFPEEAIPEDTFGVSFLNGLDTFSFQGASGFVSFDDLQNRAAGSTLVKLSNVVKQQDGSMYLQPVEYYNESSHKFEDASDSEGLFFFNGDQREVPNDTRHRDATLLKVGLLQRMTDERISSAIQCESQEGRYWNGDTCFEGESWKAILASALLAVSHFNHRDKTLVPTLESLECNKNISLTILDSGNTRANALLAMQDFHAIGVDVVVGPYDEDSTTSTALFGAIYNLPQVGYGASSTELSDRSKYPLFSRIVPSDDATALVLCKMWHYLGYSRVNVLFADNRYGRSFSSSLSAQCGQIDISLFMVPFKLDPLHIEVELDFLVESKVNILVLVTKAHSNLPSVFESLAELSLIGSGRELYLSSESTLPYLNLAGDSVRQALNGSKLPLAVGGNDQSAQYVKFLEEWNSFSLGGLNKLAPVDFELGDDFFQASKPNKFGSELAQIAAYQYDAVFLAALGACLVAPEAAIDPHTFGQAFSAAVAGVRFEGLTGFSKIDATGTRNMSTSVFEMLNVVIKPGQTEFSMQMIAEFDPQKVLIDVNCTKCVPMIFNGGETEQPENIQRTPVEMNSSPLVKRLCRTMVGICWVGAFFALVWTLWNRNHSVVKASQVRFLLLTLLGKFISTSAIIPISIDDVDVGQEGASLACGFSPWLYSIGFILSFATLFAKNERTYAMFVSTFRSSQSDLTERALAVSILKFLLVDIVILIVWSIMSPSSFERVVVHYDEYDQVKSSAGFCVGDKQAIFMSLIGFFHTVILLYGCYVSYLTKQINSSFSESKYISIALFTMLQVWCLAVPLAIVVSSDPISTMFVRSGVIFGTDLSSLILIFGPKMYFVHVAASTEGIGGEYIKSRDTKTKNSKSRMIAPPGTVLDRSRVTPSNILSSANSQSILSSATN